MPVDRNGPNESRNPMIDLLPTAVLGLLTLL
jgi:hypothetical protein